jgi:hypothetical protein
MKPTCIECGETYNPKRAALGYKTCLFCSKPPKLNIVFVDVSKSNPMISADPSQLVDAAYSNREVNSERKTRDYVSLPSYNNDKTYR